MARDRSPLSPFFPHTQSSLSSPSLCLSLFSVAGTSFVSVTFCLSVCLSFCLSVCPSACLCLSVFLPVCLSFCLPACLPVCLPACLSVGFSPPRRGTSVGLIYRRGTDRVNNTLPIGIGSFRDIIERSCPGNRRNFYMI